MRRATSRMKVRWPISHSADVCSSDLLQQLDSANWQQGLLWCRMNQGGLKLVPRAVAKVELIEVLLFGFKNGTRHAKYI